MVYSVRKLSLVKDEILENISLRIAFATKDKETVNQHFGTSFMFALYELTEKNWQLIEIMEYANTAKGHNQQRLHNRIDALIGCQAVYCNAIGSSAIKQLLDKNIQPVKVNSTQGIINILVEIHRHFHGLLQRGDSDQTSLGKSLSESKHKVIKSEVNTQWVDQALLSQMKSQSGVEGEQLKNESRLTELLDEEW